MRISGLGLRGCGAGSGVGAIVRTRRGVSGLGDDSDYSYLACSDGYTPDDNGDCVPVVTAQDTLNNVFGSITQGTGSNESNPSNHVIGSTVTAAGTLVNLLGSITGCPAGTVRNSAGQCMTPAGVIQSSPNVVAAQPSLLSGIPSWLMYAGIGVVALVALKGARR